MRLFRFSPALPKTPAFTIGDGFILLAISALLYIGARLAFGTPPVIVGPEVTKAAPGVPVSRPTAAAMNAAFCS